MSRSGRLWACCTLALSLAIGGCSTRVPVQYLLLASDKKPVLRSGSQLALGPVTAAPYLTRDALAIHSDAHGIAYSPVQLWAEPIETGVRRVLTAALQSYTAAGQVVAFPGEPSAAATTRVEIHLERFGVEAGGVRLTGYWRIFPAAEPRAPIAQSAFDRRAPSDLRGIAPARALSRVLETLAADIGAALEEDGTGG